MYAHFPIPDCRLDQVTRAGPVSIELAVQATQPQASCPTCLTLSQAVHSRYRRHPADLPSRLRHRQVRLPAEGELQRIVNAALSGFFQNIFKRRAANEQASKMREHPEGIVREVIFPRVKEETGSARRVKRPSGIKLAYGLIGVAAGAVYIRRAA